MAQEEQLEALQGEARLVFRDTDEGITVAAFFKPGDEPDPVKYRSHRLALEMRRMITLKLREPDEVKKD